MVHCCSGVPVLGSAQPRVIILSVIWFVGYYSMEEKQSKLTWFAAALLLAIRMVTLGVPEI